jgi:hypothetical protein
MSSTNDTAYDGMTIRQLLLEAADHDAYLNIIETVIRRKVLEEASVGEVEVRVRESGDELSRKGDPNRIVTVSEQFLCQTWIPEGIYRLVPKEKS